MFFKVSSVDDCVFEGKIKGKLSTHMNLRILTELEKQVLFTTVCPINQEM